MILDALVAGVDGKKIIRSQASGRPSQAEEIGGRLARQLADAGARELLPRIGGEMKAVAQASQAAAAVEPAIAVQTKKARPSPGIETGSEKHRARSSKKPLAGARVIVTRAVKQSGELIKALEMFGAEALACPTIEIREPSSWERLDRALIHLSWYDWLIFTSANGVEYFLRRMDELGHRRVELAPHRVCAVGRKTAEKLKEENIQVDLMPEKFTAEALAEELVKRFGARRQLQGARMLLPTSKSARDVIRPAMEKIGIYVEVVEAYRTVPPASSSAEIPALAPDAKADYIVFTSPSTIANLAALLETDDLAARLDGARVACIGPVTAAAAQAYGLQVHIQPEEHTGEAIVKALVKDAEEERLRK